MTTKEWAVPLVLALVVGTALFAVQRGGDGDGEAYGDGEPGEGQATGSASGTTTAAATPDILLPFERGTAAAGRELTFLVLAPHGRAAAMAEANESSESEAQRLQWQGDNLALYGTTVPSCPQPADPSMAIACDPPWAFGPWAFPKPQEGGDGRALFQDGFNATKVTAYVFDEASLLLASNANDTARFAKHPDYVRLQSSAWYLGANETPPEGTERLPGFAQPLVDRVRPQLDGLPVGGVAATRSNAYVSLYGSLFVTIRVDALVHAP